MEESRIEKRLSVDTLPQELQNIVFSLGLFTEYSGTTINASLNGFCFSVDKAENIKNKITPGAIISVIIYPEKIKLKGKIVYINERPECTNVGIQLLKTSKEIYQDLIRNL